MWYRIGRWNFDAKHLVAFKHYNQNDVGAKVPPIMLAVVYLSNGTQLDLDADETKLFAKFIDESNFDIADVS